MSSLEADGSTKKRLAVCPGCEEQLPLRLSEGDEQAALWICHTCDRPFAGVYVLDSPPQLSTRVRLAAPHFDTYKGLPISSAVRTVAGGDV